MPLSLIVAIAVVATVPVLVAVSVKVSPAATSAVVSLLMAIRTRRFPVSLGVAFKSVGICTKLFAAYAVQAEPFQYSKVVAPAVSVPSVASASVVTEVLPNASLTYWPSLPTTVNTA